MYFYNVQGFYNTQKYIEGFTNSYNNLKVIEGLDDTSGQISTTTSTTTTSSTTQSESSTTNVQTRTVKGILMILPDNNKINNNLKEKMQGFYKLNR